MKNILKTSLSFLLALLIALPAQAADRITYYHNDALGSPVAATSQTGQLLWRETYRPYGERLTKATASTNNHSWFTGKQEESALGINYFGARWYHPEVGRFLSGDPAGTTTGNIHSFNRYAYANNNPLSFIDPDGREVKVVGSDKFKSAVADNVAKIQQGKGGAALINKLENTAHVITIQETSVGNSAQASSYDSQVVGKGSDSTVSFNPTLTKGGVDANGSDQRPPFVGLAHELGHARAMDLGKQSGDDGSRQPGTTPPSERHSVANENMVRKEHGLPKRPSYN